MAEMTGKFFGGENNEGVFNHRVVIKDEALWLYYYHESSIVFPSKHTAKVWVKQISTFATKTVKEVMAEYEKELDEYHRKYPNANARTGF